jgi:hypothetical protein
MGFDESGFPSGQQLPVGFNPSEHLFDLSSMGKDELQAPEIEFLENRVEHWGVW